MVDRYYIVLEFLSGGKGACFAFICTNLMTEHATGELFDRIVDAEGGHFTEKDAAGIMCQVITATRYH